MLAVISASYARLHTVWRRAFASVAFATTLLIPAMSGAQSWSGTLSGANEASPNLSTATGFVSMSLSGSMLSLSLNWSGLSGNVTAGHIHCCTNPGTNVGVAVGFLGLPASTSGSYTNTFDLSLSSTYTSSFVVGFGGGTVAGAAAALVNGLNTGTAYVNLHNPQFPGGEIRANVVTVPTTVVTPEPGSIVMLFAGLIAVGVAVRRKRVEM